MKAFEVSSCLQEIQVLKKNKGMKGQVNGRENVSG